MMTGSHLLLGCMLQSWIVFVHQVNNGRNRQSKLLLMGETCGAGYSCGHDVLHVTHMDGHCSRLNCGLVMET